MNGFNNQTESFCDSMSLREINELKLHIGRDVFLKQKSGPPPMRIEQIPIRCVKKKRRKNAN